MNGISIRLWSLIAVITISVPLAGCSDSSSTSTGSAVSPAGNGAASSDSSGPVKGGTMLTNMPNWPENLRVYGTGSNTYINSIIEGLCYESLCSIDPETLEFKPNLATKWKISDDKMKFEFEINPNAKWSDGKPVTSEDVIATYRLIMDESLQDPMNRVAM
ncbi:MAG: ABC transporter substrate-binding protein, partial [Planctomycetaceae bacterium]